MDSRKVGKYDLPKYCVLRRVIFRLLTNSIQWQDLPAQTPPGFLSPDSTITARIRSLVKKDGVAELRYELSKNRDI
jgi:hypothetical protein